MAGPAVERIGIDGWPIPTLSARRRRPNIRFVEPSTAVPKVLEITGTVVHLVNGRDD
ncbi:MAG: hypothetical protein ABIQ73_22040 [Acidimicrobiales bacterium]